MSRVSLRRLLRTMSGELRRPHTLMRLRHWLGQLFANVEHYHERHHDTHSRHAEGRPVRTKKRSALIKLSLLLEFACHTVMGIAVGLAFAFLATHITALGIATLINYSPTPDVVMIMFVGTCAITFGIGATLTGLAVTLTEDAGTSRRK